MCEMVTAGDGHTVIVGPSFMVWYDPGGHRTAGLGSFFLNNMLLSLEGVEEEYSVRLQTNTIYLVNTYLLTVYLGPDTLLATGIP